MEVGVSEPANQAQPTQQDSPCAISRSSEASDDTDMAESENTSSEGSDSSMSESTGNSERDSVDPEPSEQHVPQSRPSHDFSLTQEAPGDLSFAAERPVLQDSISVAGPPEEAGGSFESTMPLDKSEPLEVEDSADEAYSPKLGASEEDEEMDLNSVSSSSHGDADMELTPKFQEQVVIASKNDALDVR